MARRRAARPADVSIEAKSVAFVETTFTAPAAKPFTIAFVNRTRARRTTSRSRTRPGSNVFKGDIFPGVATKIYQVPALPAGSYKFLCIVHPTTMTGTATIQ